MTASSARTKGAQRRWPPRVMLSQALLEAGWDNSKLSQGFNSKWHNSSPPTFPPTPHHAGLLPTASPPAPQLLRIRLTPPALPTLAPCQTFPCTHPASPKPVFLSSFAACIALSHPVSSFPKQDQFHISQQGGGTQ